MGHPQLLTSVSTASQREIRIKQPHHFFFLKGLKFAAFGHIQISSCFFFQVSEKNKGYKQPHHLSLWIVLYCKARECLRIIPRCLASFHNFKRKTDQTTSSCFLSAGCKVPRKIWRIIFFSQASEKREEYEQPFEVSFLEGSSVQQKLWSFSTQESIFVLCVSKHYKIKLDSQCNSNYS